MSVSVNCLVPSSFGGYSHTAFIGGFKIMGFVPPPPPFVGGGYFLFQSIADSVFFRIEVVKSPLVDCGVCFDKVGFSVKCACCSRLTCIDCFKTMVGMYKVKCAWCRHKYLEHTIIWNAPIPPPPIYHIEMGDAWEQFHRSKKAYEKLYHKKNNVSVVKCFLLGLGKSSNQKKSLSTDGGTIFSYNQLIGYTDNHGTKVLLKSSTGGLNYFSITTSRHSNTIRRVYEKMESESIEQSDDRRAWSDGSVFDLIYLPNFHEIDHKNNLIGASAEIQRAVNSCRRHRINYMSVDALGNIQHNHKINHHMMQNSYFSLKKNRGAYRQEYGNTTDWGGGSIYKKYFRGMEYNTWNE